MERVGSLFHLLVRRGKEALLSPLQTGLMQDIPGGLQDPSPQLIVICLEEICVHLCSEKPFRAPAGLLFTTVMVQAILVQFPYVWNMYPA